MQNVKGEVVPRYSEVVLSHSEVRALCPSEVDSHSLAGKLSLPSKS